MTWQSGKQSSTNCENVVVAEKRDVSAQDYILVGERYVSSSQYEGKWPLFRIGDTCSASNTAVKTP